MPLYILFVLALIQGATEFLPVSSSAHLALFPWLTGGEAQPLQIDIAVHLGTLFAVLFYYRKDTLLMASGVVDLFAAKFSTAGARLVILLSLATIPVVAVGAFTHFMSLTDALRDPRIMAWSMIAFALPLYLADRLGKQSRTAADWTHYHAVTMGLAQAIALVPGASRSGVTITAGRWLGFGRAEAARLSMLMSVPTIIASATLLGIDAAGSDASLLAPAAIAMLLAAGVAYLSIGLMLRLIQKVSLTPFVIYRIALGGAILTFA